MGPINLQVTVANRMRMTEIQCWYNLTEESSGFFRCKSTFLHQIIEKFTSGNVLEYQISESVNTNRNRLRLVIIIPLTFSCRQVWGLNSRCLPWDYPWEKWQYLSEVGLMLSFVKALVLGKSFQQTSRFSTLNVMSASSVVLILPVSFGIIFSDVLKK